MPDWCAKKSVCMYKAWKSGNTIIRKRIRQHKSNDIRQRISTYLIPISKDYFSKDTRLFTASANELKSPDTALHFLDILEDSFTSLAHFPQRVALIDDEPWHTKGIHRLPVKNFLVYFWIDENNLTVQVTAVIYGKRDQLHQLAQMDLK